MCEIYTAPALYVNCTTSPGMGDALLMLARLGRETLAHHSDADADIDRFLFAPTTTAADYRTYLARLYGLLEPYEAALATTPGIDAVIDVAVRSKAAFVAQDLMMLGMTRREVEQLPRCLGVPTFRGSGAALGWMYVMERPLLASAVIRRHLATRLPKEMASASAYLACYAGRVGTMWRELGEAMDRVASSPAIGDRIVHAAGEAFRTLHRWRTHELRQTAVAV